MAIDHTKAGTHEEACWPWFLAKPGDRGEDRHQRARTALEEDRELNVVLVVDLLAYPKFVSLTIGEREGERIEITEILYSRECRNGQMIAQAAASWAADHCTDGPAYTTPVSQRAGEWGLRT